MIVVPTAPWLHLPFDLLAWASGLAAGAGVYRWRLRAATQAVAARIDGRYFAYLAVGAAMGAWAAGSANTLRAAVAAPSHSVAGALVGAILGVELYKALRGIKGSTGGAFVASFAVGIVIGRFGCLLAGLADDTHGSTSGLPWAVDLGDGLGRHPVQAYESVSMAAFLAIYLTGLAQRRPWATRRGFYVLCIWYGAQRFAWEFLKPYPPLLGPFNVFHLLCLGLVIYGCACYRADRARDRALFVPGADNQPVRDLPGAGAREDHRRG